MPFCMNEPNYGSARHGYLLTWSLTPWSRVLLEKLKGPQLAKRFPAVYETWRFITEFTNARHLTLSWASSIQSMPPNPTPWESILISVLPSIPGSSKWSLSLGFPQQNSVYTCLLSPIRATCPAHLILLDLITRTIFMHGNLFRKKNSNLIWKLVHLQQQGPLHGAYCFHQLHC